MRTSSGSLASAYPFNGPRKGFLRKVFLREASQRQLCQPGHVPIFALNST
jgi:hypothetical protein